MYTHVLDAHVYQSLTPLSATLADGGVLSSVPFSGLAPYLLTLRSASHLRLVFSHPFASVLVNPSYIENIRFILGPVSARFQGYRTGNLSCNFQF